MDADFRVHNTDDGAVAGEHGHHHGDVDDFSDSESGDGDDVEFDDDVEHGIEEGDDVDDDEDDFYDSEEDEDLW